MRTRRRSSTLQRTLRFLALGLVVGTAPLLASETAASPQPVSSCNPSGSAAVVHDRSSNMWVEVLRGQAANAHLLNLMAKRPAAFEAAQSRLQSRGLKPTDNVVVVRTLALGEPLATSVPQSTLITRDVSVGDASGEMVFWSWDDGNPNTWEGSIYVDHYSQDYQALFEGQLLIPTSNYDWNWGSRIWQSREPRLIEMLGDPTHPGAPDESVAANPATPFGVDIGSTAGSGLSTRAIRDRIPGYLRCWLGGVIGGCTTVGWTCIGSGLGWPACFALGCPVGTFMGVSFLCLFLG